MKSTKTREENFNEELFKVFIYCMYDNIYYNSNIYDYGFTVYLWGDLNARLFCCTIAFCIGYLVSYITGYSATWLIIIVVSFIVISLQEYFKEDDKK